ncbi:MAG TPA: dihydroneopterin aldolase [Bacteroidales bacterium]|nr:dihydroneopterin aldolase [Bacteroidales bacterium]HPR56901.1 dihydroneopterin aldolase [Bacteroidales bacterium]
MAQIALENMEFFAYHGCFSEEQIIGTRFIIDLWIDTDTTEAEYTDKITQTINYQDVYFLVKEQMIIKSKLLEHVGRRILDALTEKFPNVISARIKVSKMNPPLGGKVGCVSIVLST